jgi:hypothetical protein
MTQDLIPNPALEPFRILVGEWTTTGTHGMLPGVTLKGRTSFEWLEGGAFLLVRSEIFDDPRFPRSVAILGTDDSQGECYLLTYDSRGVSRKHLTSLRDHVWRWWRDAPGFSQRYQATILDGGNTMAGKGELSKDGTTWEKDLDLTYRRVV